PVHRRRGRMGGSAIAGRDARSRVAGASSETGWHPPSRAERAGTSLSARGEPADRFLRRPAFLRGLERLEEFGLAYDILIYSRHLPVAAELAQRLPRQRFVLDHLAKPDIRGRERDAWARDLRALAAQPNVAAKLSGLVTEADWTGWTSEDMHPYVDVAFECFGAERL